MIQGKPVFLKTYGKHNRKLDAWISPNNRRQVFESTASSVSDDSIRESNVAKPTHRVVRPAKRKAMEHLNVKDRDEEDVFIPPALHSTQQNNKPISSVCLNRKGNPVSRPGRLFRRKAQRVQVLRSSESEAESSSARDENTAPKRRKLTARGKKSSVAAPPALDRFVTHRRGAPTSKPKLSTATVNALMPLHRLNSSDDFVLGRGGSSVHRIPRPPRRKAAPSVSIDSSTENSVSDTGNASSTTNPFLREISLIESADHSLVPCPRKPLFSSTPSARPLGKRPHLKTHPTKHQPSASPSVSVSTSSIVCFSTSQEELGLPGDPFSPPASAPLRELSSGGKQLSSLGEPQKEPEKGESVDLVVVKRRNRSRRSSCSVGRNNQNDGTEIQNGHSEVSSQELFSLVCSDLPSNSRAREETDGSNHFVSAAGGLEWLVEGMKEKCLTQKCTVKLERIGKSTTTPLHGQPSYSCLYHTCSVHSPLTTDHSMSVGGGQIPDHSEVLISGQTIDHSQSLRDGQIVDDSPFVDGGNSFHLELEVDSVQTIDQSQMVDSSQSVNNCDSIDLARSVTDDQFIDHSQSVDCYQSVDHTASQGLSNDQSKSVVWVESDHHIISVESITDSGSVESSHCTAGLSTEEREASLTAMVKEKCLFKKPSVQLKRMTLSQLNITQQLKKITQSRESTLVSDGQSVNCTQSAEKSEGDHTVNIDHHDSCTRSNYIYKRKHGSGDSEGKSPQRETKEILTATTDVPRTTDVPTNIPQKRKASDTQSVDNSRSTDLTDNKNRTEVLTATLRDCLTKKSTVQLKRMALTELTQRLKQTTSPSSPHDMSSASNGQSVNSTWSGSECESDPAASPDRPNGHRSSRNIDEKKGGVSDSDHKTTSEMKEMVRIPGNVLPKRKKASLAPKGKKRRSVSRDRPGTTRKACVRGLSVSRWKDKGNTSTNAFQSQAALSSKVGDCSITELLSTHHNKPKVRMNSLLQDSAVVFSTPFRGIHLNLSSLLADITPSKHTWSRLKAAKSVHRKTKAFITPKRLPPSVLDSPGGAGLIDVSRDLFATPIRKLLPQHLRSQLLQCTPLSVCEDDHLSDAEKVYAECGQEGPLSWEECILPQRIKQCKKIGEGTFGEVFSTTNTSGDIVALKIIPVEGGEKVNGEDQKTFGEIVHEIIISKELSSLKDKRHNQTHGFIGLNDLHCVRGCYPPALLKAWDAFDRRKGSENDRPDFFEEDQLFLILEFEFGGSDLENSNGMLASLLVAKSILHQVTAALAVAEQELCFEHRDLHWGNVLVKTTKEKKGSFLLNGSNHSLETKGVLVRIIDYSLSRLEIDGLTVSCDISEDEELFMGHGDYQFDIYRLMRQENGNNWADYQPHSNVLWLHYLSSKLLCMKYRRTGGRGVKDMREELTRFHDDILQYRSATEALHNALLFKK